MGKKDTGWRGWWKSLWEESVATSVATSTTVSETVSVAPSAPVSEAVSVDPTPISSGDSVTLFNPVGSSELIVDEVANELAVAGHAETAWYPNFEQLTAAELPGDFHVSQTNYPTSFGVDVSLSSAAPFGIGAWRFGSCYEPSNCLNGSGDFATCPADNGQAWGDINKYARNGISQVPADAVTLGTTPIREVRTRWMLMMERNILTGMTEIDGIKLQGLTTTDTKATTMWLERPGRSAATPSNATRWRLMTYWDMVFIGGSTPRTLSATYYIYPDTWHCIEQYWKLNSAPGVADGIFQVWWDDKLVADHQNVIISNTADVELRNCARGQIYHGGQSYIPSSQIHARLTAYAISYTKRIGRPKLVAPMLTTDLNNSRWTTLGVTGAGWDVAGTNGSQRTNMEYSNAHVHTDGRQLEFSMALHERIPGDNVGVRWAEFDQYGPPAQGYYWDNDDPLISEHDNFATCYLPWKGWVALFGRNDAVNVGALISGQKIISIDGTPSAIFRNVDAANQNPDEHITDHVDVVYPTGTGLTGMTPSDGYHNSNHNPACWVNPSGTITGWWGGGQGNSFPNGEKSIFKLLDDNPNYPATSTKQLRLRVFNPTGAPSPIIMRHMVQIGNWLYWGGCGINDDDGTADWTRTAEFYRIKVPDLANNVFTQERITDGTAVTNHPYLAANTSNLGIRFNLLCADNERNWLIYLNINGVYRYRVPSDDGNDGVWDGPHTFGMTSDVWAETVSEGHVNGTNGEVQWHGLIGSHRSDLGRNGMTFFRYNMSQRWNRIEWSP